MDSVAITNWFDTSYLAAGTDTQRSAYRTIMDLDILGFLEEFQPVLVGTIPLDLAIPGSDLDILCEAADLRHFDSKVRKQYGQMPSFTSQRKFLQGVRTSIHRFLTPDFPIEVFGQPVPVVKQRAFRHLNIEARLLEMGGDTARNKILELKKSGMKTEPAFARVFGLEGHPALSLDD